VTQVDLPSGQRSGLAEARGLLGDIEGISFCYFSEVAVLRKPLVQQIIVAYEKRDEGRRRREGGAEGPVPTPARSATGTGTGTEGQA
jgi:phosphate starvation-inducible PhoH-like protein